MFKIIFSLCIALVASDHLEWNRAMNHNSHHRATNLNRVRLGQKAFEGVTLRKLPKITVHDKNFSKIERKSLRNRMRRSYRKNLLG